MSNEPTDAAGNVKALAAISERVPQLLRSAGSAISLLTNTAQSNEVLAAEDESTAHGASQLDARKAAFAKHVRSYFAALRETEMALMKQVAALEEAGILPAEASKPTADGSVTNAGLGGLDIAWLNSRSRDVGLEKEKELVAEARRKLGRSSKDEGDMDWVEEANQIKDEVMENTT